MLLWNLAKLCLRAAEDAEYNYFQVLIWLQVILETVYGGRQKGEIQDCCFKLHFFPAVSLFFSSTGKGNAAATIVVADPDLTCSCRPYVTIFEDQVSVGNEVYQPVTQGNNLADREE